MRMEGETDGFITESLIILSSTHFSSQLQTAWSLLFEAGGCRVGRRLL